MMQHHIPKTRILKFNEEFQGQYETPTMQSNQWAQKDVTHDVRHSGGGVRREDGKF